MRSSTLHRLHRLTGALAHGLTIPLHRSADCSPLAQVKSQLAIRARIYDAVIVGMTATWYRAVLERLPQGCRLLDVGIGTGSALLANADLVREKDLHITGVDIDAAYIEHCQQSIAEQAMQKHLRASLQSIYDHRGELYDAVYFSGSFMLLPDPAAAVRHVGSLLAAKGRLYFTQTFEDGHSRLLEIAKPLMRWVTTIDFGRVTYEDDFRRTVEAGEFEIEERAVIERQRRRSALLLIARPRQ